MSTSRLFFDPSCHGNMLFLGSADPVFRGSTSFLNMEETVKKRPFFSSSDEFYEEDYYDEQLPEKKRRLTPEQVQLLEKSFETENKLEPERKTELAKKLGLQPRQVAVWFQNRRARWKTKQLERDYDVLKASYDALRADYDTIVKENEKLKLELKEAAGMKSNQTSDSELAAEANVDFTTNQINIKVEDRLSSRSGESAVIDEEYLQRIDSVDSYFPNTDYNHCIGTVDGQSDEDDISDNSQSYFSDVFAAASAADQNHQDEAATLGWWVWS